jgi:hypothetical protein
LFGGYGAFEVLNLGGAQYVDAQCFEITEHRNQGSGDTGGGCQWFGIPTLSGFHMCSRSHPADDFSDRGIITTSNTNNVLLQDLNIHGFVADGVQGPIGANITLTRIRIGFNGADGWNFDNGQGVPADENGANASFSASYLTSEWNGCLEEYPIVDTYPALVCYDGSSGLGGLGDGVAAQEQATLNFSCDHCITRYNTKNGIDLGHVDVAGATNTFSVTNSFSYFNMDRSWSTGYGFTSRTWTNDLTIALCTRMSAAIPGAPSSFNQHLGNFCRSSGDDISMVVPNNSIVTFAANTLIVQGATAFDIGCNDTSQCTGTNITFRDNIIMAYTDPTYNAGQAPGLFYLQNGNQISTAAFMNRDHNIYYGFRGNAPCPSSYTAETCTDPLFVNEPTWTDRTSLDHFNFSLTTGSPARRAGVSIPGLTTDYNGVTWASPPSVGAYE